MFKHNEPRIIDGIATNNIEYPWIVSIQWSSINDDDGYRSAACSGSLIRSSYPAAVLTAGHCVGDKILGDTGRIYYGDIGRTYPYLDPTLNTNPNKTDNFTTLRAFYYYIAEQYDKQEVGATKNLLTDYDLGIILLDGEVDIEPIELYNPSNTNHTKKCCTDDPPSILRAIGYGYINDNKQKTESIRYLDMKYMSNVYQCSDLVIKCVEDNDRFTTKYVDNVIDDGSAICAIQDNAGICQGDSGGPLIYIDNITNEIIQIGIGSQSCCQPGIPNMFANIAYFYQTIQQILNDNTSWIPYLPQNRVNMETQYPTEAEAEEAEKDWTPIIVLCTIGGAIVLFVLWYIFIARPAGGIVKLYCGEGTNQAGEGDNEKTKLELPS